MNENLLDEKLIDTKGVLIKKQHGQARVIIFCYTLFILFYMLIMTEYKSLGSWDVLNLIGKLLFFGYIFYNNFKQLKNETTGQLSKSMFQKWEGVLFLILLGLLLIHSVIHFVNIVLVNWYRFPTLVYFSIIFSIISISILEFNYLKYGRKFS